MIYPTMEAPVVSKFLFTISFPHEDSRRKHVPRMKLRSLIRKQLSDLDVIETIDHLFRCQRCFENYRYIRATDTAAARNRYRSKTD